MKAYLSDQIRRALQQLDFPPPDPIPFTATKDKKFGDLATNIALILARSQAANPRELAQRIVDQLELDPSRVVKAEVAGGGFINFFYNTHHLTTQLQTILHRADYGRHTEGAARRVNVEFVSANPTGPLSIGHGRQAVLGDVLCRLLENAGYQVTREYYFNNAGVQMRRLGESVRLRYLSECGETVSFPDDHYQGAYIADLARIIHHQHGNAWRDRDYEPFKAFAEAALFEDIRDVLRRLGLAFDVYYNEDSLYKDGRIERLIEEFRTKQLVYEKDGALWLRTSTFSYEHGAPPDMDKVIVKASGEPTYRLPDIAYHITKFERGFDILIDIFGADHIAEYPDVLAALGALGYDTKRVHVLIHQFVTLSKDGGILKMSKRKANFVTIEDMLTLLGADVFRYFLVMRSHHSHLNFDLELAQKETMENPVFYVQNAHARICSIEAKAASRGLDPAQAGTADLSRLQAEEEQDLILKLLAYPELTLRLATQLEIHPLTTYLEELSGLYHRYQTAGKKDDRLRVLTADRALTYARLALCRATRHVLAHGLGLLGVSAPTYMKRAEDEA